MHKQFKNGDLMTMRGETFASRAIVGLRPDLTTTTA